MSYTEYALMLILICVVVCRLLCCPTIMTTKGQMPDRQTIFYDTTQKAVKTAHYAPFAPVQK